MDMILWVIIATDERERKKKRVQSMSSVQTNVINRTWLVFTVSVLSQGPVQNFYLQIGGEGL